MGQEERGIIELTKEGREREREREREGERGHGQEEKMEWEKMSERCKSRKSKM
jgi:hypothetical protein